MKPIFSPSAKQWIAPYFKLYKSQLFVCLGLGAITFGCAALLMYTAGYLISWTATMPESVFIYYTPIALIQLFGLGRPVARYFERLGNHDWVFKMTSHMRLRLYEGLEDTVNDPSISHSSGQMLGYITEDIGHIQDLYLRIIFPTLIAWIVWAATLLFLGYFSPFLALVTSIALGITVFVLPWAALAINKSRIAKHKTLTDAYYSTVADDVFGSTDWILSGRTSTRIDELLLRRSKLNDLSSAISAHDRRISFISQICFVIALCLVYLWSASHMGGNTSGLQNLIAALVLGSIPLIEVFTPLPQAFERSITFSESIDRLNSIEDKSDHADLSKATKSNSVFKMGNVFIDEEPDKVLETIAFEQEDIEDDSISCSPALTINDLSFSYDEYKVVFDNLSLSIPFGEHVAILGKSGLGKSTLLSIIRGDLTPDNGRVCVDNVGTNTLNAPWRCFVSMEQNAYLFNQSIKNNLLLANPNATDDEIWSILHDLRLDEVVDALPNKLDSILDEDGSNLSGGQQQRLRLARVLLSHSPIVLLDEPTQSLDAQTAEVVIEAIKKYTAEKTLIVVTHHLLEIEQFDRVIFIDNTGVSLDDTPQNLYTESEYFRTLLRFDAELSK